MSVAPHRMISQNAPPAGREVEEWPAGWDVYRSRPDPIDPNKCMFEIYWLSGRQEELILNMHRELDRYLRE